MAFDVLEARRVLEGFRIPIQVSDPIVDPRILMADHPLVRLEEGHIDRVKPDDGHVQTNVRLGDASAEVVRARLTCKVHSFT